MVSDPNSPKILVIDDSPLVLQVVRMHLEEIGYRVVTCDTPFEGFMAIARERPDLVLVDLSMPGMDGDVLIEIIQNSDTAPNCPIVLHSDRDEEELEETAQRAGVDGYICKTSDPDEFIEQVEAWLEAE